MLRGRRGRLGAAARAEAPEAEERASRGADVVSPASSVGNGMQEGIALHQSLYIWLYAPRVSEPGFYLIVVSWLERGPGPEKLDKYATIAAHFAERFEGSPAESGRVRYRVYIRASTQEKRNHTSAADYWHVVYNGDMQGIILVVKGLYMNVGAACKE